jgi:hypothetical protein
MCGRGERETAREGSERHRAEGAGEVGSEGTHGRASDTVRSCPSERGTVRRPPKYGNSRWMFLPRLVGPGLWVVALVVLGRANLLEGWPLFFSVALGFAADWVVSLLLGPYASFLWWATIRKKTPAPADDPTRPPAPLDRS